MGTKHYAHKYIGRIYYFPSWYSNGPYESYNKRYTAIIGEDVKKEQSVREPLEDIELLEEDIPPITGSQRKA